MRCFFYIARVHAASRCRYGSPRVTAQLAREGIVVNHKAVEREMARQGLAGRVQPPEDPHHTARPAADPGGGPVRRDFTADAAKLNSRWCGDITYLRTWEGWLFPGHRHRHRLPPGRGIHAMADHLRTPAWVSDALGATPSPPADPAARRDLPHRLCRGLC